MIDFRRIHNLAGWFRGAGPENDVIVSTRVRLSRNLEEFQFPGVLSAENKALAREKVKSAFSSLPDGSRYDYLDLPALGEAEQQSLVERNLLSKSIGDTEGTGMFLRDDACVSCVINDVDHLRISAFQPGLDLSAAYLLADGLETALDERLSFAVSLEWGYLNSEITNIGTGLKGSVMLHLPALAATGLIEKATGVVNQLGLAVKGFLNEDERSLGDMYQVSNQVGLGISEKDILEKLEGIVLQLVNYERKAREEMLLTKSLELEDSVWRSYGVLKYAKTVSSREAIELLSALRLGISLGFVKETSLSTVTSLLFITQQAHMELLTGAAADADIAGIDYARAGLIHEFLSSNTLRGGTEHV